MSAFEGDEKEVITPASGDQIDGSATLAVKEASMDMLMKISPKTRKSQPRGSDKKKTIARPNTRGQLAAQSSEKKVSPFDSNMKTPKKLNLARRSLKSEQITSSQLRSAGTKRSMRNRSEIDSDSDCSDLSLSNIEKHMSKGSKYRKKSKFEKLFMTEKKAPSVGRVQDPLVKKLSGRSENLEKALDDMLTMTPKGPVLRSNESVKKEKDNQMPPPKDRKGKSYKKLARKKRLEKLLEANKAKSKTHKKQKQKSGENKSEGGPKFSAEEFGNSISQALIPHLSMLPQYNYMGPPGWTNNNGVIQGYQPPPYDPNYNNYGYNQYY